MSTLSPTSEPRVVNQESLKRRRLNVFSDDHHPAYVVWELTLACDHACTHCGSRAAQTRPEELTTTEALELADELAEMGAREVVLIGGEAYLHDGFYEVTRRLSERGVVPIMTTGGWGLNEENTKRMAEAGLKRVSVSVDGLMARHDRMRAKKGSFEQCMRAIRAIKAAGMVPQANTNFNRFNQQDLEALYVLLLAEGVRSWQVQVTAPLGRAADRPQMLFQPYDYLDFIPRLKEIKERGWRDGMLVMPGNNLGYFGPEEMVLRSPTPQHKDHWLGCQAGRFVMGVESDGAIKGCPSLQTSHYVGGRWRELKAEGVDNPLKHTWDNAPELAFTRARTRDDLWGFCAECPLADVCLGGCSFTAHGFFERPGNNPYCHFRARHFAKQGLRERLVRVERAPGQPFDNGRFEIVIEPLNAPDELPSDLNELVSIRGAR